MTPMTRIFAFIGVIASTSVLANEYTLYPGTSLQLPNGSRVTCLKGGPTPVPVPTPAPAPVPVYPGLACMIHLANNAYHLYSVSPQGTTVLGYWKDLDQAISTAVKRQGEGVCNFTYYDRPACLVQFINGAHHAYMISSARTTVLGWGSVEYADSLVDRVRYAGLCR